MHHAKTDSEVTSLAASSPPRSPRRPAYYVMSPSPADPEKFSLAGSTPGGSPIHHFHKPRYMNSPIHHSRESTTGLSFSLKHNSGPWRKLSHGAESLSSLGGEETEEGLEREENSPLRCYAFGLLCFVLFFTLFSVILWGASKAYKPVILVKSVIFESYNIQAGMDYTGVPTKMMTINSTVKIVFYNRGTFFGVHVTSTPLDLSFYDLKVASGYMREFYQSRKSGRVLTIVVTGKQIPLYGGGSTLMSRSNGLGPTVVPLNLNFVMRARAHVLGNLVKSKFYRHIRCSLFLRETRLGKPVRNLAMGCEYHDSRK
ncbi:hypothetical protein LUZ62_024347 [Rhynchospora pubera]|uniref:Late embryogenesis abundant protein LEA-2 subgroup domain-containing protein n=1 Tax=Rhynchospora pubera TaxID=906938 RepID=A0AAV8CWF8_9POAL|nr:hypothetical protein LUZ62_069693 [Rhynchospora pubera]KAJ4811781.1 hypothetical protein LUZ62_024347 [Rhynchospora pubera]